LLFTSSVLGKLVLPPPSGSYAVLHSSLKLTDHDRTDPYDPNHGKRNTMISLYYPIPHASCPRTCVTPYMPPTTASFVDAYASQFGAPNGTFGSIQMQVCCNTTSPASASTNVAQYPLVLFSPGLGATRLLYSALAQRLASEGYAVATMDHPFETMVVEYPDGSFTPGLNESYWLDPSAPDRLEHLLDVRVQDSQFVLSQLGRKAVAQALVPGATCGFNVHRAAFFGHSFGGATAVAAAMRDARIAGAFNMDGNQHGRLTDTAKPVVLFGRAAPDAHNRTTEATWRDAWAHLKGWKRELGLKDSGHNSFGDIPLLIKLGGVAIPAQAQLVLIGGADGGRTFEVVARY
ncbi:Alpha/Beta hydrolase protein, partial [Massariosphaeria phaeospora]